MKESLAYSLALDLLFNGQNMDYCERPLSLSAMENMRIFMELDPDSTVGVVGPGGGRLVRTLVDRGYKVEAYEGRNECLVHLESLFKGHKKVGIHPLSALDDPTRRERLHFDALFCMDDLRAFRERQDWTLDVQKMIRHNGYFVYSQVSNKLPTRKNPISKFFDRVGDYDVSEQTAKEIRECYMELDYWRPEEKDKEMAIETLEMIESARSLRRSIMSGVEVHYVVWRKKADK